ncbi:MAG: D-glycerate dehydrogenase [Spirochaetes bacterium]|nr:D-glycerate dehydrogenase [Spirochaetota bacterium]
MEKLKIIIFGDLFEDICLKLEKYYDIMFDKKNKIDNKKNFIEKIKDADGIIVLLNFKIDEEIIDQSKKLKIIGNYAVGYNNIDIKKATEKKIIVLNTPDVLTEATAETALTLTFMVAKRAKEALKDIENDAVKNWGPKYLLGKDIHGKIVGIIGAGRIGGSYAMKMKALGCKVFYYNRHTNPELEFNGIYKKDLNELLKISDIISIHTPLTEETMNMINEERINLMKDDAILINTSRGEVIDEEALIRALERGKFFGVGLDVFHNEPKLDDRLKKFNNVVVFPHIGSATIETRRRMNELLVESFLLFYERKYDQIKNIVNKNVLDYL